MLLCTMVRRKKGLWFVGIGKIGMGIAGKLTFESGLKI